MSLANHCTFNIKPSGFALPGSNSPRLAPLAFSQSLLLLLRQETKNCTGWCMSEHSDPGCRLAVLSLVYRDEATIDILTSCKSARENVCCTATGGSSVSCWPWVDALTRCSGCFWRCHSTPCATTGGLDATLRFKFHPTPFTEALRWPRNRRSQYLFRRGAVL